MPSHRPRGLVFAFGLHASVVIVLLVAAVLRRQAVAQTGPVIVAVTAEELAAAASVSSSDVLVHGGPSVAEGRGSTRPFSAAAELRAFDTSRIRAQRNVLFPFLTARLVFLDELRAASTAVPFKPRVGPVFSAGQRPPLALAPAALDALVDESWSRRERWGNFQAIARLASRHDPDEGQLPALVRGYVERNLLQPYFQASSPDAKFWVVLGLAADHADLIDFIGRYARLFPSSRATTELLFLLDELAEASHDAFDVLRLTSVQELRQTERSSAEDFTLADTLQQTYETWARLHGLGTTEALDARIKGIRLSILSAIVETSPDGYGVGDAHFIAGRLLWEGQDVDGAIQHWRQMRVDGRESYAVARAHISRALQGDRVDTPAIAGALRAEYQRWLHTSTARLAHFGYTANTF